VASNRSHDEANGAEVDDPTTILKGRPMELLMADD